MADFAAQAVVLHTLAQVFPQIPCVGEESSEMLRGSGTEATDLRRKIMQAVAVVDSSLGEDAMMEAIDRGAFAGGQLEPFWTLDPIDGTKGFLRNDQYAVALSLIVDGKPALGVLGCPNLPVVWETPTGERGCLFVAVQGQGCHMLSLSNPLAEQRVHVASEQSVANAIVVESLEAGHTAHDISATIQSSLGVTTLPVRMDSQAKYGALARGDGSIYLRLPRIGKPYQEKIWDHAAGVVVVEEAGGRVTDAAGLGLDFSRGRVLCANQGVIATNGPLHQTTVHAVLSAFDQAGGPLTSQDQPK